MERQIWLTQLVAHEICTCKIKLCNPSLILVISEHFSNDVSYKIVGEIHSY